MERRNKEQRQSSLPSSLIPHLYTRPQVPESNALSTPAFRTIVPSPASTRVDEDPDAAERTALPSMRSSLTLPPVASSFAPPFLQEDTHRARYINYEARPLAPSEQNPNFRTASPIDLPSSGIIRSMGSLSLPSNVPGQQYTSSIYGDPLYHANRPDSMIHGVNTPYALPTPHESVLSRRSWREGEAGPSSLLNAPPLELSRSRGRRGSSQPAQLTRHSDTSNIRGDVSDGEDGGRPWRESELETYHGRAGPSAPHVGVYGSWSDTFEESLAPGSALSLGSDTPLSHFPRSHSPFTLSSVNAPHRTWSGNPAGGFGYNEYPPVYSPSSISEMSSEGKPNDGVRDAKKKGKKRRRDSDEGDDSARQGRNPRKTAVACNFCRGRKLRCNGAKPACSNCIVRKFQCEYVPVQRRRGPGKAPKGTKPKKGSNVARSEPSTSLPPSNRTSRNMTGMIDPHATISLEDFSFQASELPPPPLTSSTSRRRRRGRMSHTPSPEPDSDADK
ncbi:hypothetical protein Hypma_000749 [Hypsizygus marmoreus]|uniref:Zn(2)-C6 fungal-type domain-containing protein n=1 Tax=Hypsizygus marmoreus TaxID=39966 RepID=A0A369J7F8_HYPMA|nr:hypothetical protein Hypma_000749 [Hypsizygus marmoreus]